MARPKIMFAWGDGADAEAEAPRCDHLNCAEPGLYRAPKSRDRLNDYFNFCLEHVRAYNKSWNYFEGMGAEDIEHQIRRDTVWDRPTWPLGGWRIPHREDVNHAFRRSMGLDEDSEPLSDTRHHGPKLGAAEQQALRILELKPGVTWEEIKARYKGLAKLLHPDANGGDKTAEERLKLVNQAYSTLKQSALF